MRYERDKDGAFDAARILHEAASGLSRLRERHTLVHMITNFVSAGYSADVLTAAGASPVMASCAAECAEMTALSSCLILNTGTPSAVSARAYMRSLKAAESLAIPVILDPVGAGSTRLRRNTVSRLLRGHRLSVIKGNRDEIRFIAEGTVSDHGVDSGEASGEEHLTVRRCARIQDCVCAVSGETDYVSDGTVVFAVKGGSTLTASLSGAGCAVTALIGALLAAGVSPLVSAAGGFALFRTASLIAQGQCSGPGTFRPALLDALYSIDGDTLESKGEIYEIRP